MLENEQMIVPLVDNWNNQKIAQKPYPVGVRDWEVIDAIYNKLHAQGRMEWVTKLTAFTIPIFVVWRTVNG